jgi:hypothetical protein
MAGIVAAVALARVLPHPPNFAPAAALALFAAVTLTPRWLGLVLPMAAMFLSDVLLEVTTRLGLLEGWLAHGHGFHHWMVVVYAAMAAVAGLGMLVRGRRWEFIPAAAVGGSVLFFLVTNFAVWAEGLVDGPTAMYPPTWDGLVECYVAGLPFYRMTLVGDLLFCGVLFGGLALADALAPTLVREALPVRDRG